MTGKPTNTIKVIIFYLIIIIIFSVVGVFQEISDFSSQHTTLRILDTLFRATGGIFSFIGLVGLLKMKKFGYTATLIACVLEIALRSLVYFPNAKVDSSDAHIIDLLAMIPFVLIFFYLYSNRKKFIK